jgi:Glycosyl transferase family 2
MAQGSALSVVVTLASDTCGIPDVAHLQGCLRSLEQQRNPPSMEVLVVCDTRVARLTELRQRFPEYGFIVVPDVRPPRQGPSREHHDKLRRIGITHAASPLIALLEDHERADPDWAAQTIKEHTQPYAAIGGAVENDIDRPLNWAVYFSDFYRYQNPLTRGPSQFASDVNVCYKRAALDRVSDSWHEAYSERRVHRALRDAGEIMLLSPDVVVYQHRCNLRLRSALRERYAWGRSYAAERLAHAPLIRRLAFALACPAIPVVRLSRQLRTVMERKRHRAAFCKALPLALPVELFWAAGEFVGYLTGTATSRLPKRQARLTC